MMIVEQGRVIELSAEPGIFIYKNDLSPSIFAGNLKDCLLYTSNNNLLKAKVELKEKQAQTDEHMRIYDKITEEVAPQLQKLESLLTFSEDSAKTRENLGLVCVISSYIKRRSNLILLGEEASFLPAQELEYCLRESMENLRLCGVAVSYTHLDVYKRQV